MHKHGSSYIGMSRQRKSYQIYAIERDEIEYDIKQLYKRLEDKEKKKIFRKMLLEVQARPQKHYDEIADKVAKEFENFHWQIDARVMEIIQNHMTNRENLNGHV